MNIHLLLPKPSAINTLSRRPSRDSLLPTAELLLFLSGSDPDDHFELNHLVEEEKLAQGNTATELALIAINHSCRREAFANADVFRKANTHVCLWGDFAEEYPEACAEHADTLLIRPAPEIIATFIKDFKSGKARRLYVGSVALDH